MALVSGLEVIPGSLGQKLCSPHHVRPLMKILANYKSDCGFINLVSTLIAFVGFSST